MTLQKKINAPIQMRVKAILTRLLVRRMKLSTLTSMVLLKRTKQPFRFDGREHPYLFHSYNNLGLTERSVEIPLIRHYVTSRHWKRVLEIGNVTNYYEDYFSGLFPNKTVVDKTERNYNIITADIAGFVSTETFDFIFSISTFEHMDSDHGRNLDYCPNAAQHGTVAADNIIHCYEHLLAPGGMMVISAPLGYTPEWDKTIRGRMLDDYGFTGFRRLLISRVSEQEWVQQPEFDLTRTYSYGQPYPYANHLSIVEISK